MAPERQQNASKKECPPKRPQKGTVRFSVAFAVQKAQEKQGTWDVTLPPALARERAFPFLSLRFVTFPGRATPSDRSQGPGKEGAGGLHCAKT